MSAELNAEHVYKEHISPLLAPAGARSGEPPPQHVDREHGSRLLSVPPVPTTATQTATQVQSAEGRSRLRLGEGAQFPAGASAAASPRHLQASTRLRQQETALAEACRDLAETHDFMSMGLDHQLTHALEALTATQQQLAAVQDRLDEKERQLAASEGALSARRDEAAYLQTQVHVYLCIDIYI